MRVARAAAEAGLDGLAFLRGIPGSIGGALRMNAGAHGGETKDVLIEARGVDRTGAIRTFGGDEMHMTYRHSGAPEDIIFTSALFQGRPGEPEKILAEMDRITEAREASQPIREKTGGSTFKNPPGEKAWQLIDRAGCRGLVVGDAQVSQMHCNFLINRGAATAADIENLGDEVRAGKSGDGRRAALGNQAHRGEGVSPFPGDKGSPPNEEVGRAMRNIERVQMTKHVAVLMGGLSSERSVRCARARPAPKLSRAGRLSRHPRRCRP